MAPCFFGLHNLEYRTFVVGVGYSFFTARFIPRHRKKQRTVCTQHVVTPAFKSCFCAYLSPRDRVYVVCTTNWFLCLHYAISESVSEGSQVMIKSYLYVFATFFKNKAGRHFRSHRCVIERAVTYQRLDASVSGKK